MKNEKGIATWIVILLIAIVIVVAIYFSYYAKPMATVMMGGAEQAKPAIQRAERAKDTMDKVTHVTEDVSKKANEEPEKEK